MWKVFAAPLFLGEASVLAAEAVTACQEGRGDICIQYSPIYFICSLLELHLADIKSGLVPGL